MQLFKELIESLQYYISMQHYSKYNIGDININSVNIDNIIIVNFSWTNTPLITYPMHINKDEFNRIYNESLVKKRNNLISRL